MDRILNSGVLCGVLLVLGAAADGAVWRVSPAVSDGMTGPEQITNALARLASGDYQLHALSPLRGRGLLLDWTADDLDLAGNPRVRGGTVDLGCLQCWTNPRGTVFLVK